MISPFTNEAFLVFLGVNLLLAWGLYPMVLTGQLSVGQAALMAIGAYASSWATVALRWPLALSLLFGSGFAAVAAAPVAVGANRIRGIHLIIGTLAIGQIIMVTLTNFEELGGVQGYFGMAGISLRHVWLACLGVLLLLLFLMRTQQGIAMRSIRDDEEASESLGVPTRALKIRAVVLGAAITGLAGALQAHYLTFIRPDGFGVKVSFLIALFVLVGGTDNLVGPAAGAFVLTYLPETTQLLRQYRGVVYGLFLIAVMILSPRGLLTRDRMRRAGSLLTRRWRARRPSKAEPGPAGVRQDATRDRRHEAGATPADSGSTVPDGGGSDRTARAGASPVLQLSGIIKRFAGVVALDGVDLEVRRQQVVGLIGPNGAGKTTLVNIATGLLSPTSGEILLEGKDVTHLAPHRRVERGMARTFQAVRLFPHLTVAENLSVAVRRRGRTQHVQTQLRRLDLHGYSDELPPHLPYGAQRKLQLAQVLMSDPEVVLLDEPSIGMNAGELEELVDIIRSIRADGTGVLVVDHNLDMVMDLADTIVVLDFGRKIAQGPPQHVMSDPAVQSAYLGMTIPGQVPSTRDVIGGQVSDN